MRSQLSLFVNLLMNFDLVTPIIITCQPLMSGTRATKIRTIRPKVCWLSCKQTNTGKNRTSLREISFNSLYFDLLKELR